MGGRGNGAARNTGTKTSKQESFIGKHVDVFKEIKSKDVEELLGLSGLTQSQKNTIADMLRSMAENDYSYTENHSPYKIEQFSLTKIGEEFSNSGTGDISVLISTYGDTGREVVDLLDHRTRLFIIGRKGGARTYTKGHKPKAVSNFEVRHGSLD